MSDNSDVPRKTVVREVPSDNQLTIPAKILTTPAPLSTGTGSRETVGATSEPTKASVTSMASGSSNTELYDDRPMYNPRVILPPETATAGLITQGPISVPPDWTYTAESDEPPTVSIDIRTMDDEPICTTVDVAYVSSVFGRRGAIEAVYDDYSAILISYDNSTSSLISTNVQAAIDEMKVGLDGTIGDAAADGNQYARQNGEWSVVETGGSGSTNQISQGDTDVTVADTGPGSVVTRVDGTPVITVTPDRAEFIFPGESAIDADDVLNLDVDGVTQVRIDPVTGVIFTVTTGTLLSVSNDTEYMASLGTPNDSTVNPTAIPTKRYVDDAIAGYTGLAKVSNNTSNYTLTEADSASYIVFNSASDLVLTIPDGLSIGVNAVVCNIGTGNFSITFSGSDTAIGQLTLADPTGLMSIQKLASTTWHTSERG